MYIWECLKIGVPQAHFFILILVKKEGLGAFSFGTPILRHSHITVYLTIKRKALKCIHRPQDIQVLVDNEVVASLQGCETREDWDRILICFRKNGDLSIGNMVT